MGREIRRVPPGWVHPRYTRDDAPSSDLIGRPRPCFDKDFRSASEEYKRQLAEWEAGLHEGQRSEVFYDYEFWEYESPPNRDTCRPSFTEEPTWWQVYETVTEGTPVSPAFPTAEALIEHLVQHGDDWAQKRGDPPPSRAAAEAFVRGGWAPSGIMRPGQPFRTGIDAMEPE